MEGGLQPAWDFSPTVVGESQDLTMHEWTEKWRAYQEWAESHAEPDRRSPERIMADLEFLYASFPEHVRRHDPDPQKLGIQEMRRALGLLDRLLSERGR